MSQKITRLNHGQGFTSNLVTALLVIFASRLGLPVSTTHVSVGSLFGIGLVTRQVDVRVIVSIILSWVLTLPVAAILAWGSYWLLKVL
jgi:PiT family inorganic phosphate transporter